MNLSQLKNIIFLSRFYGITVEEACEFKDYKDEVGIEVLPMTGEDFLRSLWIEYYY